MSIDCPIGTALPRTGNSAWGFNGTIAHRAEATAAWPLAMAAVADAAGCTPDEARAFLDSRQGRHFADDVSSALFEHHALTDAIAAVTAKWMGWTIRTRHLPRDRHSSGTALPHGLRDARRDRGRRRRVTEHSAATPRPDAPGGASGGRRAMAVFRAWRASDDNEAANHIQRPACRRGQH